MRKPERFVTIDRLRMSLVEAAKHYGVPFSTVCNRYRAGLRGRDVVRRPYGSGPQHSWELGISLAEWVPVLEYASERGAPAARQKFGLPQGAVNAALRGEWERIA